MLRVSRLNTGGQRVRMAGSAGVLFNCLRWSGVFPYAYSKTGNKDAFFVNRAGVIMQCILSFLLLSSSAFICIMAAALIPESAWMNTLERIELFQVSMMALGAFILLILRRRRLTSAANSVLKATAELLDFNSVRRGVKRLVAAQLAVGIGLCGCLHLTAIMVIHIGSVERLTVVLGFLYGSRFVCSFVFWSVECMLIDFLVAIQACFCAADKCLAFAAMSEGNGVEGSTAALRRLVLRRQALLELAAEVNSLFAPLLLMSAGLSLIELLFSSFNGVSYGLVGDKKDLQTSVFYIYLLGWFVFHAVRFCLVCKACDAVSQESRGAACRLHRVLNALPDTAVRTRARLYEYSFALRNCPFRITAMDFFDMNLRLCLNMISGLATYLIILLQFKFTPSTPNA